MTARPVPNHALCVFATQDLSPSERVIATGDLMHGLLPSMGDGFPDEWPATLKALEALEFDRVIPGHGSIQEGKSVLSQFRGYVEEITEKVSRGIERGQALDELKKTITLGTLTSLKVENMSRRVERELGTLFPVPETPASCRGCGHTLRGDDPQPLIHQVAELPKIEPIVDEYRLHRLTCPDCETTTCGTLPEGVPTVRFGPYLQATLATLAGAYRLSKRQIQQLAGDLFGLSISAGMISKLERMSAEALQAPRWWPPAASRGGTSWTT